MKPIVLSAALCTIAYVTAIAPAQEILKVRDGLSESGKLISKMQGRWKLVAMQKDGEEMDSAKFRGTRTLIREDRLVMTKPDGDADVFRFTVNVIKTQNQIDLTSLESQGKTRTLPGIIEFESDTLWLIVNLEPGERPVSIRDAGKQNIIVMEFERVKCP